MKTVLRRAARCEFDEATEWYEERKVGLGAAFVLAVNETLLRIAKRPDLYPLVLEGVRECIVQGFPYCVYYRVLNDSIDMLAVFHTSRDPTTWKRRV